LQWAKDKKLPVSIHSRKAYADILKILKEEKTDDLCGVLHCFGGDIAEAYKAIEMGFYLGIGGVVTYKNAGMAEIVKEINLEYIILETDAPYLPPVPFRGKRNESAFIFEIASFIADIKNISVEEVAMITTQNAKTLYKF
jgi:TatD DNase family protein